MQALLYLIFILSGAAGLFYESVWSRYLSLFVGHGAYAQVIVLVIFLGGMALGAMLVSRRSAKLEDPLYGYAVIEVLVGLVGLVFHDLIYQPVTGWAYDSLFPALGGGVAVSLAKWGLAGLLILPQSILLGATFPLMSAGLIRRSPERPGSVLSILYFTNSLGAAAGVLIAGFVLVRVAGLPGTLLAAAILNLVVGLVAFFIAKLRPPAIEGEAVPPRESAAAFEGDASLIALPMLARLLLLAALGTAIASFVYEVAWIRLLSLVLGSATHSFELMLSAFILGLSLGAFWIRRRMETMKRPLATLVTIQMVMGGFALLSLAFYQQSFQWTADLLAAVGRTDQGYTLFTLARYGLCLVIMLPATFCAGMTLPLITRTLFVSGAGESAIGRVYSWNTFGSIIGAAAASLVLIPLLGLKGTLILGGVIDMLVGLLIVGLLLTRGALVRPLAISSVTLAIGATLAVLIGVQLDRALLISGVFRTGKIRSFGETAYYRDGRTSTVSVSRPGSGRLSIATNGKPDGSLAPIWFKACRPGDSLEVIRGDDPTQILLSLVTLAHRTDAKNVAVIGMGTGMSSSSLLASPSIESLVTVEIEPVMVEAAREFYPANKRVFDDSRAQFIFDDAKAYFAGANRQFDIIVAEPSNPWVSGVSGLFTAEFYSRVKRYMAPGAVLGQWLHTYELTDDLVLTVLGAIHKNFSDYRIYSVNSADLLIVAVAEGQVKDPDWGVFSFPEVRQDLCHFHPVEPADLDMMLLTSKPALAPLLDHTTVINSDFFPVLDLGAESSRFLGRSASAVNGIFKGLYDFAGPAGSKPIIPDGRRVSAFGTIPRIGAVLQATELRLGAEKAEPSDTAWDDSPHDDANQGIRRWLAGVRAGEPSGSWSLWAREYNSAFTAWHAGTRGWLDSSFTRPVHAWLARTKAPEALRATVAFRELMARGAYQDAAVPAAILVAEAKAKRFWVDPDVLREGVAISFIASGRAEDARAAIELLSKEAGRPSTDFRTRLLTAWASPQEPNP